MNRQNNKGHINGAISLLLALSLSLGLLSACGSGRTGEGNGIDISDLDRAGIIDTVSQAYQYALPLIIMDLTKKNYTNVNPAAGTGAPLNQISHNREPAVPEDRTIVRLNVDTLYSNAFLEISAEPIILEKPQTDIYATVAVLDAYTNCAAVLGTGGLDDGAAATYAFCLPDFAGELPAGVVRIDVPTDIVWLFFRTRYDDSQGDPGQVHAIQDQYAIRPLSEYGNAVYVPPTGSYDAAYDYVTLEKVFNMGIEEFFTAFNELAIKNPGTAADAPALEQFAKIGVGPGLTFQLDMFPDEDRPDLDKIPDHIISAFMASRRANAAEFFAKYFHDNNGWLYPDEIVARYGTEYAFRAYIAVTALGANPVEMAVYPSVGADKDKSELDGNNNYVIRFEAGQFPPHLENGFWSITLYDSESFLYPNEAKKQAVRNIDPFVVDTDGSVTIYLQHESPGDALAANWLPTPLDKFTLSMRVYRPDPSVTDLIWQPPFVERVDSIEPGGPGADSAIMSDAKIIETALAAYHYAIPLVMMDLTKKSATNMNPERPGASTPVNTLYHARIPMPPEQKTIMRTNVDTLYSIGYLEIADEPLILTKPKTDIYSSISLLDAHTNSAAVLGTGGDDNGEAAIYALCYPDFAGELPEGAVRIDIPTNLVWLAVRTSYENTPESLAHVHALQDQFSLVPLSAYGNADYVPPAGSFNEEYVFVPLEKMISMSITEFFNAFNALLTENPGADIDAPHLEQYAEIGVGAGLTFSLDGFSDEVQAALTELPTQELASLMNDDPDVEGSIYAKYYHILNNWMYPDDAIAEFGTAYDFRALIAVTLFGANPVEMAIYVGTGMDSDGETLDGHNNYVIRFEAGQLPPFLENGFWSITLYDEGGFLYPNEADKQAVRGVDGFVTDADGSVTIYLQHASPGADLTANWLPTPLEAYNLTLRIYLPHRSVMDYSWEPPFVERVE